MLPPSYISGVTWPGLPGTQNIGLTRVYTITGVQQLNFSVAPLDGNGNPLQTLSGVPYSAYYEVDALWGPFASANTAAMLSLLTSPPSPYPTNLPDLSKFSISGNALSGPWPVAIGQTETSNAGITEAIVDLFAQSLTLYVCQLDGAGNAVQNQQYAYSLPPAQYAAFVAGVLVPFLSAVVGLGGVFYAATGQADLSAGTVEPN